MDVPIEESTQTHRLLWMEALYQHTHGNLSGALLMYRRILNRTPGDVDAWCNLGGLLNELGRFDEALAACEEALRLAPDHGLSHCNLGHIFQNRGDFSSALVHYRRAVESEASNIVFLSGLAGMLGRMGDLDEALALDERALAMDPGNAELHLNHGYTLMRALRLEDAEASLLRALDLDSSSAKARWNLAYVRMLQGRFQKAWPDFPCRLAIPEARANCKNYQQPCWDGGRFQGRTLLVWVEQGFGDSIQFVRYLPWVKELGGTVLLLVYEPLKDLFRDLPGVDGVFLEGGALPSFDVHIPLLDLPVVFQSTPEDLPCEIPYLRPPQEAPESLRRALETHPRGARVGLVWTGNRTHVDDHHRSLPVRKLDALDGVGAGWYSLQLGATEHPALPGLVDLAPHLRNFADTAYAICEMDLVISVDTAVAHLAGALGVPTLLLLPYFPDWRWILGRDDTPWYPTVQIHRQPAPRDWDSVIQRVLESLR